MSEYLEIEPRGPLRGEINVPGDKSISHRALMLSSIANGRSIVKGLLRGEDVLHTWKAMEQMGVRIEDQGDSVIVHGVGLFGLRPPGQPLYMGNAGTAMRLLAGILAGQSFQSTLTGDESLSARPMKRIMIPLRMMGAKIEGTAQDTAPLHIEGGPLVPIRYQLPVASAQVKSCILLAGMYAEGRTEVIETELTRDHTERMLEAFGARLEYSEPLGQTSRVISLWGRTALHGQHIEVPGDFSSAAFFIVAGLLVPGSEITLRGVGVNPTRTGLLDILARMGAKITLENERTLSGEPVADLTVSHQHLRAVTVSAADIPRAIDELPILSVAAALAQGTTVIRDAAELRYKESDRIETMVSGLSRMGVKAEALPDGMVIQGREELTPAEVESKGDHRVAMSFLIAGLLAKGKTLVRDTEQINTSFPNFSGYLTQLAT